MIDILTFFIRRLQIELSVFSIGHQKLEYTSVAAQMTAIERVVRLSVRFVRPLRGKQENLRFKGARPIDNFMHVHVNNCSPDSLRRRSFETGGTVSNTRLVSYPFLLCCIQNIGPRVLKLTCSWLIEPLVG